MSLRERIRAAALTFAEEIATALEEDRGTSEWVDQYSSPLGKRRHLEAVRHGKLTASREGRRVLVRRADIDAYFVANAIPRPLSATPTVDDVLKSVNYRRSA